MIKPKPLSQNKQNDYVYCIKCGKGYPAIEYLKCNNYPFKEVFPVCRNCVNEYLRENDDNWEAIDKLCRTLDIPFIPKEVEKMHKKISLDYFFSYAKLVSSGEYENLNWGIYFEEFRRLQQQGYIGHELPSIDEEKRKELIIVWGPGYDLTEMLWMDNLLSNLLSAKGTAQGINLDVAKKLCKISLLIDSKLREGADIDKLTSSYEKFTKIGGFNVSSDNFSNGIESTGEMVAWLEKRGWINKGYDNADKDIVDEVIHSIQNYVRRLYTNESGLGEEINERIERLENAEKIDQMENEMNHQNLLDYNEVLFENDPDLEEEEIDNNTYVEGMVDNISESPARNV